MAKHDLTTPPTITTAPLTISGGTSRRSLAGGAFAALLAATAAPSAAKPEPERLATLDDYAIAEFEGWSAGCVDDLGSRESWMAAAADHWAIMRVAIAAMQDGHLDAAEKAGQAPQLFFEFVQSMGSVEDTFRGFADVLQLAQLRVMSGLARHAVSVGEA